MLGYYVNYVAMLALVGLPHMEYLVVIGQRTSTLWQDWSLIFPKLILYKFVKWVMVGVLVGGIAGLLTGKAYASLLKHAYKISSG